MTNAPDSHPPSARSIDAAGGESDHGESDAAQPVAAAEFDMEPVDATRVASQSDDS